MSLSSGRVTTLSNLKLPNIGGSEKKIGIVYDVILDNTHPRAINKNVGSLYTGCVIYKTSDNVTATEDDLPIAWPIEKNFKSLPVRNELVEIYQTSNGAYGYRRIFNSVNPSTSNPANLIRGGYPITPDEGQTARNYQETSATGITNTNFDNSAKSDGYGKYYQPQNTLHKLKLYEGDTLIESRFGQSIRFSGYFHLP